VELKKHKIRGEGRYKPALEAERGGGVGRQVMARAELSLVTRTMEFILSIFKSTIICEKQLGKLGYTKIKEETINNWNCYYY